MLDDNQISALVNAWVVSRFSHRQRHMDTIIEHVNIKFVDELEPLRDTNPLSHIEFIRVIS